MPLSLSGTTPNDLFSDSVSRLAKPWSPEGTDPSQDVTLFARQVVRVLTSESAVAVVLAETSLYDLFRSDIALLRDRTWDASTGGLQDFSEALAVAFGSQRPIGISAGSTSLYELYRSVIALLRSRSWSASVRPFADELVNVLSSESPIAVVS